MTMGPRHPIAPALQFTFAPPRGYVLEPASSRQSLALSPDGSRIAFTAMDATGLMSVFVRDFRALEARPVSDSIGAHSVFWGADEKSIYFTAKGSVRREDLQAGSYQVVSKSPTIISSVVSLPSGDLLVSGAPGTFTVSGSGGALRPVKQSYRWSQLLPDGQYILHTIFDPTIGRHRARWRASASRIRQRTFLKPIPARCTRLRLPNLEEAIYCPCEPVICSRIPFMSIR